MALGLSHPLMCELELGKESLTVDFQSSPALNCAVSTTLLFFFL